MKTIAVMMTVLAGTLIPMLPLRAMDEGGMCKCMKGPEEKPKMMMMGMDKMKAMEKKMAAEEAELQKLVDEMNASTGDKKLEALSALVNKMVQNHKVMCREMKEMKAKDHAAAAPKEEVQKAEDPHAAHQH